MSTSAHRREPMRMRPSWVSRSGPRPGCSRAHDAEAGAGSAAGLGLVSGLAATSAGAVSVVSASPPRAGVIAVQARRGEASRTSTTSGRPASLSTGERRTWRTFPSSRIPMTIVSKTNSPRKEGSNSSTDRATASVGIARYTLPSRSVRRRTCEWPMLSQPRRARPDMTFARASEADRPPRGMPRMVVGSPSCATCCASSSIVRASRTRASTGESVERMAPSECVWSARDSVERRPAR